MGTGGVFLRRVRARISDEPTGFLWIEKDRVAASGYPASRRQVEWLARQGIDAVLTLTERPLPSEWTDGLHLVVEHVPMADHEPPKVESLERAVTFVQTEAKSGKKVLVHCLAGQGRTMCVLAGYLMKERKVGHEEAVRTLRAMKPGAVERGQEKALMEYAEALRKGA